MISRAGTIFRRRNGVTQESGAIFNEKRNQKRSPIRADSSRTPAPSDKPQEVEFKPSAPTLDELTQKSARILYRIKTTFPFVLFPDEIVVDEEKVTVIVGMFFKSGQMRSIMLRDISAVTISTDIFFASMRLIDRNFVQDPLIIRYLHKERALKMRRIIMGLIIADKNNVELSEYPLPELRDKAEGIGRAHDYEDSLV